MKNFLLILSSVLILLGLSLGAILLFIINKPDDAEKSNKTKNEKTLSEDEIRGVWIATVGNIDFPSKQGLSSEELKNELDDIVDTVYSAGLNSIFFQVRPASDSFYGSDIFPASVYINGKQGQSADFDIFGYLINKAAERDIRVFAWINPLRVTASASLYGEDGLPVFAETNPASIDPDMLFEYDSLYYYDPGLPKVRKLIADGAAEAAEKYDIAGVVFDDYFYPYPKEGQTVDDAETFAEYGKGFDDVADWRRNNVNKLVKECYDAVKSVDENVLFGISPFGIWKNDDGKNGGSPTKGLEAYDEIYCDALAWIEGGYVDFICPQLYWNIGYPAADYAALVKWWDEKLEGHDDIALLIGHGAYKISTWENKNEITDQLDLASKAAHYCGSVFYGYAQIRSDERGILTTLSARYKK